VRGPGKRGRQPGGGVATGGIELGLGEEDRLGQVGPAQIGPAQVGPGQVGAG
jgi:hypothetical protein